MMKNTTTAALLICLAARTSAFAAANLGEGPKAAPEVIVTGPQAGPVVAGHLENVSLGVDPVKTGEVAAIEQASLPPTLSVANMSAADIGGYSKLETAQQEAESPRDQPSMAALKRELRALERQQTEALGGAITIGVRFKDAPSSTALEVQSRLFEQAETIGFRVDDKKKEIAALRQSDRVRYNVLKRQMAELKTQRESAAGIAAAAGQIGHEYKGGAAEARARQLERVDRLDVQIAELKRRMGVIERDNPSFAGLRAPVVVAMDLLGVGPMPAPERQLRDEIKQLSRQGRRLAAGASVILVRQHDAPSSDAIESAARMSEQAASISDQVQVKKRQLVEMR